MQYLALVLLLLAWLNPLHIGPWVSWHNEVLAFAAITLLFAVVLQQLKAKRTRIHIPRSALVWLALFVVVVMQSAWGQIEFIGDAAVLVFYIGLVFIAQISGFALVHRIGGESSWSDKSVLIPLAVAILLGASVSALLAFVQTADVWPESEWILRGYSLRRPGGNMGQPNQLATLLLMGIASLNYLFGEKRLQGIAAFMLFGLLIAGLGLTESRSGVLGAFALLAFALLHKNRALAGQSVWYCIPGFALLIVCFKVLPTISYQLLQAGTEEVPQLAANLTAGTRLVIWPQLIEASMLHPWLGWGLRQVPLAYNAVLHNYSLGEAFTYAHNLVLDIVLGVGYPLGVVLVGAFSFWTNKMLRAIADRSAWYCMALLIPLVVHSLLEFPFAYAYFLVPVALAIGVMEAQLFPNNYIEVKRVHVALGHTIFVLLLLWSVWEYIAIEEDFRVARFEALRIGKTPVDYNRPHTVLLTQLDAMLTGIRLVPEPGMNVERIEAARAVAMRFPWPATQNRYALTLALNGNPDEAIRQIKVIRAMHGEKTYQSIRASWQDLALTKYPQLNAIQLP